MEWVKADRAAGDGGGEDGGRGREKRVGVAGFVIPGAGTRRAVTWWGGWGPEGKKDGE